MIVPPPIKNNVIPVHVTSRPE